MNYFFIIFFILAFALIFGGHWFLYSTLVKFFKISDIWILRFLKIFFAFMSVSFIAASFLSRYYNSGTRIFYIFSAVWLGMLFYLFAASCAIWLVFIMVKFFVLGVNMKILSGLFFGAALAVSFYGIASASNTKITEIKINLPNAPEQWKDRKAVWISDLHLGQIYGQEFAAKIAEKIKSENPDIIFIGGDLYDGFPIKLDYLAAPLFELKVPKGVYFITGNHEEFENNKPYLDAIGRAGINILNNRAVEIDGVKIIGVDYRDTSDAGNFSNVLSGLAGGNKSMPMILLKHTPFDLDVSERAGIDFQISGHTHQAQIFPLNYITRSVYKGYDYGFKKFGSMQVYVSSGTGTWGPPLRIGTVSEIVVINF